MHDHPFDPHDPDHEAPDADHSSPTDEPTTGPRPLPQDYDPAAGALLTEHAAPLFTRDGQPIICPACHALRDWLVIAYRDNTWIRCRCAHEWGVPDDLDAEGGEPLPPDRYWDTLDAAITSLGFDGLFAGLYLNY